MIRMYDEFKIIHMGDRYVDHSNDDDMDNLKLNTYILILSLLFVVLICHYKYCGSHLTCCMKITIVVEIMEGSSLLCLIFISIFLSILKARFEILLSIID